jgi:hypothetical protein
LGGVPNLQGRDPWAAIRWPWALAGAS